VKDCDLLYEATFLSAVAFFEDALELLLTEMISGQKGTRKGSFAVVSAKSRDVLRHLIHGDLDYVEMLPFDKTVKLARRFPKAPVPFEVLDGGDRSRLADVVKVRNAIAHRSPHALGTFRTKVTGVNTLPLNRRYPGPFLRQVFRVAPDQTRHELYLLTLSKAASEIRAQW
jgi:hypothetical protein